MGMDFQLQVKGVAGAYLACFRSLVFFPLCSFSCKEFFIFLSTPSSLPVELMAHVLVALTQRACGSIQLPFLKSLYFKER